MKKISILLLYALLLSPLNMAQTSAVRIKDIGKIVEARDNQLIGFGVVVGLRGTGDSRSSAITQRALQNLLGKLGVSAGVNLNSRNSAAVMVTATLAPFVKKGQRITVTVSAMGDSTNLSGGTLLIAPLKGPDLITYAVAQGPVIVGGINERSTTSTYQRNQTTVGMIPEGAIVEEEVPVTFLDQHNITIVLNDSNFMTVSRTTDAIQKNGYPGARAIDANTIKIPLSDLDSSDLVNTIAQIEDINVIPDSSSKIIINSRTGTVVIGEMVRLFPVAITHGSVSIRINESDGGAFGAVQEEDAIQVDDQDAKLVFLNPAGTLSSLVDTLNEIGASPKDLISIIQALKESGALIANIEVI